MYIIIKKALRIDEVRFNLVQTKGLSNIKLGSKYIYSKGKLGLTIALAWVAILISLFSIN